MKIVAFLQNLWVKQPERVGKLFADHPEKREYILKSLLFRGGRTGRILQNCLGDFVDKIIWEETTREIAGDPKMIFPADLAHIRRVIEKHETEVILTFGRIAAKAVRLVYEGMRAEDPNWRREIIWLPHPCARPAEDAFGAIREARIKLERLENL